MTNNIRPHSQENNRKINKKISDHINMNPL